MRLATLLTVFLLFASGTSARQEARLAKAGELIFLSGANGDQVDRFKGASRGDEFGTAMDAQSVFGTDGGGLIVGAPGGDGGDGQVFIIDLGDGSRLQIIRGTDLGGLGRLGEDLTQIGHINGDFGVHLAVGAPGVYDDPAASTAAVVFHQIGTTYVERLRIAGEDGSMFGWTVAPVDANRADSIISFFAIGAPRESAGSKDDAGAVHVYDSVTGAPLWSRSGKRAGELFGYSMQSIGDLDGDGASELLVGAPGAQDRKPAGRVYVLSGQTGNVLQQIDAPDAAALFGFALAYQDLDGDGVFEPIVSAPTTSTDLGDRVGTVHILYDALAARGGRGEVRIEGSQAESWFGIGLAGGRSLEGTDHLYVADLFRDPKAKRDLRGRVSAVSADGTLGEELTGKRGGDHFGMRAYTPFDDRDDDGVTDILVSITRAARAFIPQ